MSFSITPQMKELELKTKKTKQWMCCNQKNLCTLASHSIAQRAYLDRHGAVWVISPNVCHFDDCKHMWDRNTPEGSEHAPLCPSLTSTSTLPHWYCYQMGFRNPFCICLFVLRWVSGIYQGLEVWCYFHEHVGKQVASTVSVIMPEFVTCFKMMC